MFHHFHDDVYPTSQGSISKEDLISIIEFINPKNILNADEWIKNFKNNSLSENELCITFDHGLKCQFDIALPVLKSYGITAFWFVYSSPIEIQKDTLEVYRHFRMTEFNEIDDFYNFFFDELKKSKFSDKIKQGLNNFDSSSFLSNLSFYTYNDRKFRYIRDVILTEEEYFCLMDCIIESYGWNVKEITKELFITNNDLLTLKESNHVIGLHSYFHPTVISKLSYQSQKDEYIKNKTHLEKIVGKITTMSHPSNAYNDDTLTTLKELGIETGFIADMSSFKSNLEIPRQDHTNIMKMIQETL